MEALITLFALPVVIMSSIAGGGCSFQEELIGVVEQDTTMTQPEKDRFIERVKTKYSECFIDNS